jgi:hypothetical protein
VFIAGLALAGRSYSLSRYSGRGSG